MLYVKREKEKVLVKFHTNLTRIVLAAAALATASLSCAMPARAQLADPTQNIGVRPELLKDVGIDQKLNDPIPLDLTFRDEHGKTVQLGKYFGTASP